MRHASIRRVAGAALAFAMTLPTLAAAQTPPPPPSPPAAPDPHALYAGTYTFVGGQAQRTEVDHAIDRAVDGMFFVTAAVARGRLHGKNPIYNRVIIGFPPGQISVAADARAPFVSPENGARVQARDMAGDPVRLQQRWENGHVVMIIATDEGYRRNDLILSPDGRTLTMQVELVAGALPHHLRYSLTFRR